MIFSNTKHWLLYNILAIIGVICSLIILAIIGLRLYTHHGVEKTVPNFTGLSISQANLLAKSYGLNIKIIDSVYIPRMNRGVVYSQNPKPLSNVKNGRRILVTINSISPKKVAMPNLLGMTIRQAMSELSSRGLELGRLIYVNDIATNSVLAQMYNGQSIEQGSYVPSGAVISLLLGLNPDNNMTEIPDVTGLKYKDAVRALHNSSLNISSLDFGTNVKDYKDSINSIVISQEPADSVGMVVMGTGVLLRLEKK